MERRSAPRIPLDTPCLLTLIVNETASYPAMLTDISINGVQLTLPPTVERGDITVHMRATLTELPLPLKPYMENSAGVIVWMTPRHIGVRLDTPLLESPQVLVALDYL